MVAKCQLRAAPRQADKDRRWEYNSKGRRASLAPGQLQARVLLDHFAFEGGAL